MKKVFMVEKIRQNKYNIDHRDQYNWQKCIMGDGHMIRCSKCNSTPSEQDIIGWKCNSCQKAFQVTKTQLQDILMKKETNPENFFKCPSCGGILDDGEENIAWKCSCGNVSIGKLQDYKEKEEIIIHKSNMIRCPECGKEISAKAKRCVHCGKVFVEEEKPTKICGDCGKEVADDATECPFCGCPLEDGTVNDKSTQKKGGKKAKKIIIPIAAIVVAVAIIAAFAVNFIRSSLSEDEQLAYQNAVKMKSMMRDPDSFKLYDEMFLLRCHDDDGNVEYTYTIFKYGGTNGYGAMSTDEAIFRDDKYIMDYADEPDEDDPDYIEKIGVQLDLTLFRLSGEGDTWKKVDIDIEKVKKKMGLD